MSEVEGVAPAASAAEPDRVSEPPTEPAPVAQEEAVSERVADAPAATEPPERAEPTPNLLVDVVREGSGEPVAGATVLSWVDFRDREPAESDEPVMIDPRDSPRTDDEGRAALAVETGVRLELSVLGRASWKTGEEPEIGNSQQQLEPLLSGEVRRITVELPHGLDLVFWGRAVTEEGGRPIEGAVVAALEGFSFGDRDSIDPARSQVLWGKGPPPPKVRARSDAEGRFELRARSWSPGEYVLFAPSFGPRYLAPETGHETPDRAKALPLARAAVLRARVVDRAPDAGGALSVHLSAKGYDMGFPAESDIFLGSGFFFDQDPRWRAAADSAGLCIFPALPARVPFTVEIWRGGEVARRLGESLSLTPGETREVEWPLGEGARIVGRVVDQDERPVRTELWLLSDANVGAPDGVRRIVLREYWKEEAAARVTTDGSGEFEFIDVPAGRWWIGPAPLESHGDPAPADSVVPEAVLVELAGGMGRQDLFLSVHRGLFVEGRVVTPDAERGAAAWVECTHPRSGGWFHGQSDAGGSFRIGPLPPGEVQLGATSMGRLGFADSLPVTAQAGDSGVEIPLRVGGSLIGHVTDATTGARCDARLVVVGPERDGSTFSTGTGAEEGFECTGLSPGTYDLVAVAEGDRVGFLRGLEVTAGGAVRDLRIEVHPGARLRIRYEGEVEYCHFTVFQGGLPVEMNGLQRGRSTEVTAPAGEVEVELDATGGRSPETRVLTLAVGEVGEIVYRPES